MAKELPYFQFEPAEYLTKDVSFCSLSAQGLFINMCAYYWQRGCQLTRVQMLKRLNYEDEFNELAEEGVINLEGEKITIKFLDEQFNSIQENTIESSKKGKIGNLKRWNKDLYDKFKSGKLSIDEALEIAKTSGGDNLAIAKTSEIREEKIKEEEIREEKKNKKVVFTPPAYDEFLEYALEAKPNLKRESIKFKFMAWSEANWVDGNGKKITNWKSKLLNTIPHLQIVETKTRRVAL